MSEMDNPGHDQTLSEPFVRVLLANQENIRAYVASLTGDLQQAEEIVQETNVVLCREARQFPQIADFTAWACRTAYFQVLKYRKDRQRDRHRFDDALLPLIAERAATRAGDLGTRRQALTECLAALSDRQRSLILQRYDTNASVQSVAKKQGRTPGAISQSLYRIRAALMKCIRRRIASFERGC
jgi:RNA polymerase sigma-70 factor (ECF subfamily)